MPQTHHHALLLLGAVAGMFPVSSTWNLCVESSGSKYWEEWRTDRTVVWGETFWKEQEAEYTGSLLF